MSEPPESDVAEGASSKNKDHHTPNGPPVKWSRSIDGLGHNHGEAHEGWPEEDKSREQIGTGKSTSQDVDE
jgi:hypothetical protein